jgi:hypothetical protein
MFALPQAQNDEVNTTMEESREIRYITRTYRYDYLDRIISQSDGSLARDEFVYDPSGNLISRGPPGIKIPAGDTRPINPPAAAANPAYTREEISVTPAAARVSKKKFCPRCGAPLKENYTFCNNCGFKVV